MKLYTEEQVREMLSIYVEFTDNHPNSDSILNEYTSIQLPTDEEIKEEIEKEIYYALEAKGFYNCAKWMRDKIKGDNS